MRYRILGILVGLSLSLVVVLILLSINVSADEVWSSETIDNGDGHTQGKLSIALDSKDYPHFVHHNYRFLEYVNWTGSGWNIEIIDYESYGLDTSLALDSQDRPHILYGTKKSIRYAHWTGEEWIKEILDTDSDGIGNNADLDDDGDGYNDDEDAYPMDPDRWEKGDDTKPTTGVWIWFVVLATIFMVVTLAFLIYRKKKGGKSQIDNRESGEELTPAESEQ